MKTIEEFDFRFTRRRYGGRHTFTWVSARKVGTALWMDLGDPWPAVTPKKTEMLKVARRVFENHEQKGI